MQNILLKKHWGDVSASHSVCCVPGGAREPLAFRETRSRCVCGGDSLDKSPLRSSPPPKRGRHIRPASRFPPGITALSPPQQLLCSPKKRFPRSRRPPPACQHQSLSQPHSGSRGGRVTPGWLAPWWPAAGATRPPSGLGGPSLANPALLLAWERGRSVVSAFLNLRSAI